MSGSPSKEVERRQLTFFLEALAMASASIKAFEGLAYSSNRANPSAINNSATSCPFK